MQNCGMSLGAKLSTWSARARMSDIRAHYQILPECQKQGHFPVTPLRHICVNYNWKNTNVRLSFASTVLKNADHKYDKKRLSDTHLFSFARHIWK